MENRRTPTDYQQPAEYHIRVHGCLDKEWEAWFEGMHMIPQPNGDTLIAGRLDQAALHGLLKKIRDLGLPLLSIERVQTLEE